MMAFSYIDDLWKEEVFGLDTPAAEFPGFQSFVELWQSKRVDGSIPDWRDFDLEDFKEWYGWISVFDIIAEDPFDFHTRLWGTNVVDLLGFDMSGKSPRVEGSKANELIMGYEQSDLDFMATVQRERAIGLTEAALMGNFNKYVQYKDLFVPLSTDGQVVDKLMSLTQRLDP